MASQRLVSTLKPGNVFRDWLAHKFEDELHDDSCKVNVYLIPASHTVCRFEFKGEGFDVVSKFYAEPTGGNKDYNAKRAMDREYEKLHKAEKFIDISRPLAKSKRFNCALVTEYIKESFEKLINRNIYILLIL